MAWKSLEDSSSEEDECDSEEMPEPDQFLAELEGQASSSKPQKPDKATKAEEKERKQEAREHENKKREEETQKAKEEQATKRRKNRTTRRKVAARSGASLQLPRQQNGCELEENELIAGCGIEKHTGGNETASQAQWLER